ncbi:fibronectin type III-like domain-contianing protein [Streptomyces sp. NRRL S-340]|uniref:fibronectin type III-like domain-contianing protein n=1 Tax=Streptomyces sp. NRRL S-340 TaxID=1463901 RepID=UPI0005666539
MRVGLRNTGRRTGREVVQVYLARPGSVVERPERRFAGYAAVRAEAGGTVAADVVVPARALRYRSEADRAWRTEPGTYRLMVGRSAGDLRWEGPLTVTGGP